MRIDQFMANFTEIECRDINLHAFSFKLIATEKQSDSNYYIIIILPAKCHIVKHALQCFSPAQRQFFFIWDKYRAVSYLVNGTYTIITDGFMAIVGPIY